MTTYYSSRTKTQIIGYRCISDCTLNYTNFEDGEEIIIPNRCEDSNWVGTDFFDNHPFEFDIIPLEDVLEAVIDGETNYFVFPGGIDRAKEAFANISHGWDSFEEWCEMKLSIIY